MAGLLCFACDGTLAPVRGTSLDANEPALAEPLEPGLPEAVEVMLTVRSDQSLIPISPWIYGINGETELAAGRYGLTRLAGQRWSAYNWENNASNAGSDYLFQNDGHLAESDVPGEAVRPALAEAEIAQAAALVSIAILDAVAADKRADGDVRDSGADWLEQRFEGNAPRHPAGASPVPDRADGAVYQADFVAWARAGFEGTSVLFSLDSAPDLWRTFHPTLHPEPVTYAELVERTLSFATAVKEAWPSAPVVGFGSYGWSGWESLTDPLTGEPPPDAAGNGPFLEHWLGALRAAEAQLGRRLVDFVDLHWHPEATGDGVRILEPDGSAAVIEARLQAPRSLWDPTYVESSWITDVAIPGEAVRWIPRMQERIERAYPGTRLAIGEWSFGGGEDISGALATADALGAFGRHGVGLAAHNGNPGAYVRAAFAAYRDYDGAGAQFGDTALTAVSDRVELTSVYASLDLAAQERVVLIAINKAARELVAGLRIAHPARFTRASTYRLDATGPGLQRGEDVLDTALNAFTLRLAARSLTVVELNARAPND